MAVKTKRERDWDLQTMIRIYWFNVTTAEPGEFKQNLTITRGLAGYYFYYYFYSTRPTSVYTFLPFYLIVLIRTEL